MDQVTIPAHRPSLVKLNARGSSSLPRHLAGPNTVVLSSEVRQGLRPLGLRVDGVIFRL